MAPRTTWGTHPRRRAGLQAGGLFFGRVRHSRVGADLFRRLGRAFGRPYQECQRPGRAAGGHRLVLRPGLFQAASRHRRLSAAKNISTRRSKTCRWSRPWGPTASRSPFEIDTRTGPLLAKVWLMHVGRVDLYLLDCDVDGNSPEDRELTSRLYGGDHRTRIRQELVLGVGGVKALRALGIHAGRVSSERRAQRVRHAGSHPRADARRRPELRRCAARSGPAHRVHHAHARAGRARPLRRRADRRALGPAARSAGHFARSS